MENLPPHIIRLVYKEVTTLTTDPPDGIKVFPNEEDLTDLQVTIEGPGECGPARWLDCPSAGESRKCPCALVSVSSGHLMADGTGTPLPLQVPRLQGSTAQMTSNRVHFCEPGSI